MSTKQLIGRILYTISAIAKPSLLVWLFFIDWRTALVFTGYKVAHYTMKAFANE